MEETKLQYPILNTFTKIGDVEKGLYLGYDLISYQPGISNVLFKLEKDGQIYYLPTFSDLNKKLIAINANINITINYVKDETIGMVSKIKVFEVVKQ